MTGFEFDPAALWTAPMRWATFAAVLLVVGAVGFHMFVLAPFQSAQGPAANMMHRASLGAARLGALAAAALLPLAGWRLWIQISTFRAPGEPVEPVIEALLARSAWGRGWWLQVVAAALAAVAFSLGRRSEFAWFARFCAAGLLALTPAFAGHAGSAERAPVLSVGADWLHVMTAGTWLGTMFVLVVVGLPRALDMPEGQKGAAAAAMVRAFSALALWSVAILAGSGVVASLFRLGTVAHLWQSAYGLLLVLKLLLVGVMAGLGAWHWKRLTPRLMDDTAVAPGRSSIWREVLIGGLVLAVTAVLAATPFPGGTGDAGPTGH